MERERNKPTSGDCVDCPNQICGDDFSATMTTIRLSFGPLGAVLYRERKKK